MVRDIGESGQKNVIEIKRLKQIVEQ